MSDATIIERLKHVSINGTMRGPDWLDDLGLQASRTATECDSAFHETVSITLRRAAIEIRRYQQTISDMAKALKRLESGEV
jgi:hypothetical protein